MSFRRFPIWRIALFAAVLLLPPLGAAGPARTAVAQAPPTVSVPLGQRFVEFSGSMNIEVTLDHGAPAGGADFVLTVHPGSAHAVQNKSGESATLIPGPGCPAGEDFLFGDASHGNTGGHFNPGTTSTHVSFPLCNDLTPEPDETFTVEIGFTQPTTLPDNPDPLPSVTIVDDDIPPQISIPHVVSKAEGTQKLASVLFHGFGTTPFDFPVTLSRAFGSAITIPYTLQENSSGQGAHHGSCASLLGVQLDDRADYTGPTAGTLIIPAYSTQSLISVPVCADLFSESDESFFVPLGAPSKGTLNPSASGGNGEILNDDAGSGTFRLAPRGATARAGAEVTYRLLWTVPKPHAWRALRTIDLRILDGHPAAIWLRWAEASNTFRLVGPGGKTVGKAGLAGKPLRLAGRLGTLNLETSSVVGSGPHGRSVTLTLGLDLPKRAAGHTFRVEVASTDDLGHVDAFRTAGTLAVK